MTRQEVKHAAAVCKTLESAERMIGRLTSETFRTVTVRLSDFDTATSQKTALRIMEILRDDMKQELAALNIEEEAA